MKKYLLTMLAVLVGSNMWAQSFSYDKSNKTLTIEVTTDLSNDDAAAGKVQAEMATDKPETVIVNGGGKINSNFVKAILYGKGSNAFEIANTATKTLDLRNVVLVGWTSDTFCSSWGNIYNSLGIKTLTLPQTPNNVIPDEPFIGKSSNDSFWPIEQIIIPDGCVKIGAYFTKNMSTLKSVKWPDSVKEIGDMAFANLTNWDIPALPKSLEIIGNSAFALKSWKTCKTITFPSSVKIICPGAFLMRQYQEVYFQSKTAPLLPLGESLIQPDYSKMTAFGAETLMGNNGFGGSTSKYADDFSKGKANRENYVASSGAYFAILHFPKGLTDEEKATYTDIDKKYETWKGGTNGEFHQDATKVVGSESSNLNFGAYSLSDNQVKPGYKDTYVGEDYIWPSQSQWMRSYLTASNGVCWDGVKPYTPGLSAEQIALLRKVGGYTDYTDDDLKKIAHVGTRQFVLTADDATTTPEFPLPLKKGGRWWTLCVPFNMTKKMIDESMGEGTQVCRFSSVKREMDMDGRGRGAGKRGHHITLQFRNDVYKHKYVRSADGSYPDWDPTAAACSDDDIVIYAHEPYMVYPTKKSDDPKDFVVKEYEAVPGSPLPTVIQSVKIQYNDGMQNQSENSAGDYRFIGNYINQTVNDKNVNVPVNSYFYGKATASDTESKFWFWPYDADLTWPSNKCTVQTTDASLGIQDAKDFFNFEAGLSASSKTQSSLFGEDVFDDNGTTSIDKVEIVAGEDSQEIYNISGQLVSTNGTFAGLPKGIYVKGGKKFIVK